MGALLLTQLQQVVSGLGASADAQLVVQGAVIALAAAFQRGTADHP